MKRAKIDLSLSEALWDRYPNQSEATGNHERVLYVPCEPGSPWVQFTYGGLRTPATGEIFAGLHFGGNHAGDRDLAFTEDGMAWSDVVISFEDYDPTVEVEVVVRVRPSGIEEEQGMADEAIEAVRRLMTNAERGTIDDRIVGWEILDGAAKVVDA